ncbi:MAG: ATP-dependent Clp protease ATP-binding subunit [Acidobacteria bacterium]|nr:ATP-dependent Clp protease ATP-binding subunit [Acidobacteriota bacterium]MBV9483026.1 ATP-dependent Clp protease ATP-binding subunit [Acidobacteriota bacterium]
MFERYTEKARRVIFFARYEASQFGSPHIEAEHLLLGLVREDKALINRFLHSHASLESIRKQIEGHTNVREKVPTSVDLPLSNESKRVLAHAADEAERLGHKHIGSEHLLLGLLRDEKCFAAQLLAERDLRLSQVREELARQPHEAAQGAKRPSVRDEFSHYVSDLAEQTQPLVGREDELGRLIELLCRFTRKNPVLVGEPGVGKRTIAGGLARRIADGNIPQSLAEKAILALDLPPLRLLEKSGSWHERLDQALVAAAADGKIFFVNRMHDRARGISSLASNDAVELLQRPIIAGKIQCIGTSTPAAFTQLQSDGHWLADYFEPIEIVPSNEESASKVLHSIRGVYETFHNVSYTDDAIMYAVLWAGKYIKRGSLPGTAVEVIDEAGAAAQRQQGSAPEDVVELQKRIRLMVQRLESSIANHEFDKARLYSSEERKERANLEELRKKYKLNQNPVLQVRREEVQRAVSKLTGTPVDAIR